MKNEELSVSMNTVFMYVRGKVIQAMCSFKFSAK
jgi:hypothetical protein